MWKRPNTILGLVGMLLALRPATADGPNLAYSYRSAGNPAPVAVSPTGTISFPSTSVGSSSAITFILSNKETPGAPDAVSWTVSEVTTSSPMFRITSGRPAEIGPGEDRFFTLSFFPTVRGPVEGSLQIRLSRNTQTASVLFFLTGAGLAPDIVFSYILTADGNQLSLGANDPIAFAATGVGQSTTASFIISNRGNGPGTVHKIVLAGSAFRLSGLPLLPADLDPVKELRFSILFAPTSQEQFNGSLRIEFGDSVKTVALSGQGTGATLVYECLSGSTVTTVGTNGTVTLPPTSVGASASVTMRVRNLGNGSAQVTTIAITGTGFQVASLPFLPATIPPGQSISFTVTLSPPQNGPVEGRLRIDNTVINLAGTGLGASLQLLVRQGSSSTPVAANGTVTFPNTTVGAKSAVAIQIQNDGNVAAQVNSISQVGDGYLLEDVPPLPSTIAAGASIAFTVVFAPKALGTVTGAALIDGQRIGLAGVGEAPPPLPAVAFTGVGESVEPAQQPAIGLTLAARYPLEISGKLTLSFTSDSFVDDPAIQFATGGRSVDFRIPAQTTEVILGQGAKQVQLQTGTVAGVITIAATFSIGAVDLTPAAAPVKTILVAGSEPRIRSVQLGARTATSFELLVTGYSTPRAVTQMTLRFEPAPGANLQTTSLPIEVETPFSLWYQSAASRLFGSQFTVSVNIVASGDIKAVQSVTVTASNSNGTSAPRSLNLQ